MKRLRLPGAVADRIGPQRRDRPLGAERCVGVLRVVRLGEEHDRDLARRQRSGQERVDRRAGRSAHRVDRLRDVERLGAVFRGEVDRDIPRVRDERGVARARAVPDVVGRERPERAAGRALRERRARARIDARVDTATLPDRTLGLDLRRSVVAALQDLLEIGRAAEAALRCNGVNGGVRVEDGRLHEGAAVGTARAEGERAAACGDEDRDEDRCGASHDSRPS
jgi:hypothetical protein